MTDSELLRAAVAKAGGHAKLAALLWAPSHVTLWRWRRAGRIPKDRDRRLFEEYVKNGPGSGGADEPGKERQTA